MEDGVATHGQLEGVEAQDELAVLDEVGILLVEALVEVGGNKGVACAVAD